INKVRTNSTASALRAEKRREAYEREKEKREMQECTFRPQSRTTAKGVRTSSVGRAGAVSSSRPVVREPPASAAGAAVGQKTEKSSPISSTSGSFVSASATTPAAAPSRTNMKQVQLAPSASVKLISVPGFEKSAIRMRLGRLQTEYEEKKRQLLCGNLNAKITSSFSSSAQTLDRASWRDRRLAPPDHATAIRDIVLRAVEEK
ncbi:unnamed protein product, partial [Amoebophrya sp. A120]